MTKDFHRSQTAESTFESMASLSRLPLSGNSGEQVVPNAVRIPGFADFRCQ